MGAADFVRIVAAACAFAAAALLTPQVLAAVRRSRASERANRAAAGDSGFVARLLRNGVMPATAAIAWLSRFPAVSAYCAQLRQLARRRGFETGDNRVGGVVLMLAMLAFPLGWLASSSPVFGCMASLCLVIGLGMGARHASERESDAMREAVPEVLHMMSSCFHAGYSLLQTFRYIADEAPGRLHDLFFRAASDLETGRTAEEALRRMRDDASLPELAFVTAALDIQHQTGGSLQKVIDSASESVAGELALRRALRVQTAQARLSMRIVTIMPFVLVGIFSFVSPGFLSPFFTSGLGIGVLCLAFGMQAAGILSVRRMLDVGDE